ncbi:MAG: signal peptidase I [Acidimicrobiales bacterium]
MESVAEQETSSRARSRTRSAAGRVTEWVVIVGGALLMALAIKAFVLQAFYIPSASMVPTLKVRDRVLVNKLSYRFHEIHRGDIVVFRRPPGETDPRIKDLIKRVVALPDETVEFRDGHVWINGRQLLEPYLPKGVLSQSASSTPERVPHGDYWVMGDNRMDSKDSRSFGPIPKDLIVGRAFVRVWPLSSLTLL